MNAQSNNDMAQPSLTTNFIPKSVHNNPSSISPIQIESFSSFPVNQVQKFDIILANQFKPVDLIITISNSILGIIDRQLEWTQQANGNNKCRVMFRVPMVGIYTIKVEIANQAQYGAHFQAKAYDLSKVFINGSSGKCSVNQSYEFSVDASEAGEGQLEIAVNEGEIPNQVQVLDNGKCIVNFVPEECIPHVVDIKFNGHNVNGCPFVVEVNDLNETKEQIEESSDQRQQVPNQLEKPILLKDERVLVNTVTSFSIDNIRLDRLTRNDILIIDPENQAVNYKIIEDPKQASYKFEFLPIVVGDYTVELGPKSSLQSKLPPDLVEQFPFLLKIFDFSKVIVSDVVDGIIGHPIFFFIDASQAGSGNLEIRVSSKTRNVPNHPQSEANAKIRVNFTPTEAVDHSIDVKFNGIPVPGNPFLVKVAQFPQARLPISSQDLLKYVAINESVTFQVDYIGSKENRNIPVEELTEKNCQVHVLGPDFITSKLDSIELVSSDKNEKQKSFKIDNFKPTRIGPYKLFITVNNELIPGSPILSNVYNIDEVKVYFESNNSKTPSSDNRSVEHNKPVAHINKPVTFTVDASRAGEGTLALAVVSGISKSPVQTDVKVSDKGHGLYNLTFIPTEFAPHSIDMSFNDHIVPDSPFIVEVLDSNGRSYSEVQQQQQQAKQNQTSKSNSMKKNTQSETPSKTTSNNGLNQQVIRDFESLSIKHNTKITPKLTSNSKEQPQISSTNKKSLAYGLVNTSNVVYLESGVLDGGENQVSLIGPNGEKVPFMMGKGSPSPGELKKPYIEYKPKSIGTHTISVRDGGKDLRQYFVEICDPSLIKVTDLDPSDTFIVGRPVIFYIESHESGEIQLDSITIFGPKKVNGKVREGDQTILSRLKSISSSSSSATATQNVPIEYLLTQISEHKQEVKFIPQVAGKYSVDIRCLGQSIGFLPVELEVKNQQQHPQQDHHQGQLYSQSQSQTPKSNKQNTGGAAAMTISREDELLQNIVVHGISLKCSPVNSTGAFIIETNRMAQARDFDVLITDPSNNLVDVQCYLQQDGNLLAEWTPKRVGTHKIEVLYKDRQVPGSPFISEAFDPSGVIVENVKNTNFLVNDEISFKLDRRGAGCGELDVAITSPVGSDLPIDVNPLDDAELGEIISFRPTVAGKYKISITFGGYEVPKSPITFTVRDTREQQIKVSGLGLRCAEVNRSAQFIVESQSDGELKLRIECGDREIVPKIEKRNNIYTIKYKPTEVGYSTISVYWNGSSIEGSPFSVPINDLSRILFLSGTNKSSNSNNQRIIDYEPKITKEITVDTSKCGPGELKAEAYCRANPSIKFSIPVAQYVPNRYRLEFVCPPKVDQLAKGITLKDLSLEATYLIRFYYNNLIVPEQLASVVVSPLQIIPTNPQLSPPMSQTKIQKDRQVSTTTGRLGTGARLDMLQQEKEIVENNNNSFKLFESKRNNNNSNHEQKPSIPVAANDEPIVALRGHGLVDAKCGEEAEFTIDGSEAGYGIPSVRLNNSNEEISVRLDEIGDKLYRACYVAQASGVYSLNVLWDGKQVAGCPITVNVLGSCDPNKVLCTGDGLKGGILGEEIKVFIDTRRAGPGELTALCTGPQKVAFCELLDRGDGTFILYIKPQEPGRQLLTIKYGGQHIPKSPFLIKVSGKPDPSKVRVCGPGVEHGVLSLYQSRFVCDTRGAGAGQLTVRIRGPKGAFRMETQRESQRDRTILCKYDPTEPGDYRIEIKWSGRHVPGSPFSVMIFDTQEELNRFLIGAHNIDNNIYI